MPAVMEFVYILTPFSILKPVYNELLKLFTSKFVFTGCSGVKVMA
jgi:hypothetical protein